MYMYYIIITYVHVRSLSHIHACTCIRKSLIQYNTCIVHQSVYMYMYLLLHVHVQHVDRYHILNTQTRRTYTCTYCIYMYYTNNEHVHVDPYHMYM